MEEGTEREQEFTGTIVKLLDPKDKGFIQYQGDKLIYFKNFYGFFFRSNKRGTWQIGDRVIFSIREDEQDRCYAKIVGFIENPILEKLILNAQKEGSMVLKGFLTVFDGDLFFQDSSLKLIFAVQHLTISDINLKEEHEYKAILNVDKSSRIVALTEWIELYEQLKLKHRNREIISSTIIEVRMDYIKVSISGTPFYGKVLGFDRTKEYRVGENIDLYTFIKNNYKFHFSDVTYRRINELPIRLPIRGNGYQAVINDCDAKYYQIEIVGENFNGVLPKVFLQLKQKYVIGKAIDVIYAKRTNDLRYMFFTTQQFEKIKERKKKRKQRKASSQAL